MVQLKRHTDRESGNTTTPFFNGNSSFRSLTVNHAPTPAIQREDEEPTTTPVPIEGEPSTAQSTDTENTATNDSESALPLLNDPFFPRRLGLPPLRLGNFAPIVEEAAPLRLQFTPPARPSILDNLVESEPFDDPNYPIIGVNPRSESRQPVTEGTRYNLRAVPWLSYLSFTELAAPQHRLQWAQPTFSARRDSYSALRIGNEEWHLDVGSRGTMTSSESSANQLSQVEDQAVGFASLRLKYFVLSYWNDHSFWWWPLADGGDQGDTAGLSLGYLPTGEGLPAGDWKLTSIILNMRLASGIPIRGSEALQPDGSTAYEQVVRPDISRGDLTAAAQFTDASGNPMEFGFSSGRLRHAIQSDLVHNSLGIPEFKLDNHLEGYVWFKYSF